MNHGFPLILGNASTLDLFHLFHDSCFLSFDDGDIVIGVGVSIYAEAKQSHKPTNLPISRHRGVLPPREISNAHQTTDPHTQE